MSMVDVITDDDECGPQLCVVPYVLVPLLYVRLRLLVVFRQKVLISPHPGSEVEIRIELYETACD